MNLTDIIKPTHVTDELKSRTKPELLRDLARLATAETEVGEKEILTALAAREQLGSTGIGQGIAIPHARLRGLKRVFGLFARLKQPVEFAAVDDKPVDLTFLLLTPAEAKNDHLAALAAISRRLRDKGVAARLRASADHSELYAVLTDGGLQK